MSDTYSAVWVSHTSISDFLKCPRSYYLKNVYKDPRTGHKIKLMSPSLALGQAVHEALESLSVLPAKDRFRRPLAEIFAESWQKVSGKNGGFIDSDSEYRYKSRGLDMIARVNQNRGPLVNPAVKIKQDLPHFWLSEDDGLILCGKIDWLEYLPETDSVHIIDFKTSKYDEDPDSLQLPIYHLLVHHCQHRQVSKASYWYLDRSDVLEPKVLPDLELSRHSILKIAKRIKLARQLKHFVCEKGGCPHCLPFEDIVKGKAEFVGTDPMNYDVYIKIPVSEKVVSEESSVIL
ncbi:PD-(D/E)XK nuclease family protein [Patescibacteria group bacterium]|nr:PD-(D/E)XK nuclease family protein [Patescibacteria group bacterium]